MRIIFLGRKPYSCKALEHLLEKGVEVVGVVTLPEEKSIYWSPRLADVARKNNVQLYSERELYDALKTNQISNIDLAISYLYWKKIKKPLILLPQMGCINFHPAPLPELRGLAGYNIAVFEQMHYYGVSAHFVNESIDSGDLLKVNRFDIDPAKETVYSLEKRSQKEMFDLFKEVIDIALSEDTLPREPQGDGRYIDRGQFERMRMINPDDTTDVINRRIRAFWYPPQHGAFVTIDGQEYTLVNKEILEEIGKYYHN